MSTALADVRERAAAFVAARGDALECAAARVLCGASGVADLERRLGAAEPADPDPAGGPAAARRALGLLADAGALESPLVARLCRRLERIQSAEGCWEAGAEEATLFETGLLAGLMARTHHARAASLDAAGDWLAERFSPERVQGFAWPAIAAYAACFANLFHEESDSILQWCGRELERGRLARRFDPVQTARVLVWCDAPSLPGGRLSAGELLEALAASQSADGSWPAPPGAAPVAHALDALAALRRFAPS